MSNIYDFMEEYDRAAQARALDAMDGNPDEAAQAVKIGNATGRPAAAINGDKDFQGQYQGALAGQFIRNNPHIAEYVNSHPLAANVSSDDFGQLDKISSLLPRIIPPALSPLTGPRAIVAAPSVIQKGIEGFVEGWGEQPFAGMQIPSDKDAEFMEKYPALYHELRDISGLLEVGSRGFSGAIGALRRAAEESLVQTGADRSEAAQLARDIAGMAEMQMLQVGVHGAKPPGMPEAEFNRLREEAHDKFIAEAKKYGTAIQDGKPWFPNEPPPGVNKIIDDLKAKQAQIDGKNHQELANEVQKSATQQRLPEFMENFIRMRSNNQVVSVSHEALARLYGEREPVPGDGIIGDTPNADVAYRFSRATGGDVDIPLEYWNTKVPKEVQQELQDNMKFRPGGISKTEGDALREWHAAQEEREPLRLAEDIITEKDLEEHLPISAARRQAGVPTWEDYRHSLRPSFEVGAPQDVDFYGGKIKTILSTTVGEAGKELNYGEGVLGSLAEKVLEWTKDVAVHVVKDDEIAKAGGFRDAPYGYYDSDRHHIVLSEDRWRDIRGGSKTFLHEAVHAATSRALQLRGGEQAISLVIQDLLRTNPELAKHYGTFWGRANEPAAAHEFLAEAVSNLSFQNALAKIQVSESMAKALGLKEWAGKSVWRAFTEFVHNLLGLPKEQLSALDAALSLTETFAGLQKGLSPRELAQFRTPHRFEVWARYAQEQEPFEKAAAGGYTENMYKRWRRLIERQREDELRAQEKKAAEIAKKQASSDWKANRKVERREALDRLVNHPVPQATEFLRDGMYQGQKLAVKPKLDISKLTPEQRAALPRDFYGRGGLAPDDVASMFGISSGDELIRQVAAYEKARGKMRPDNYLNKLIEEETDRRMEQKFGSIGEQAMREAQEHIVGDNNLNLIHEETLALAAMADEKFSLTKEAMRNAVTEEFGEQRHVGMKREKFLNEAGKAGRNVEMSFLKGDYKGAFRWHQAQYWDLLRAKEAMKLEAEKEKYDAVVKKYQKRDVPNRHGEFTPWIQQLLINHGYEVARGAQDHAAALEKTDFKTLESFVTQKQIDGFDVFVDDRLYTPGDPFFNKKPEDMTVNEWRIMRDAVVSLDKSSLNMKQAQGMFEAMNLDKAKDISIQIIKARAPSGELPPEEPYTVIGKVKKTGHTIGVMHLTVESKLNWLDKDNPRGFFHRMFVYPMAEAANAESRMIKIVDRELKKAAGKIEDIDKVVVNTLFREPGEPTQFIPFRKHNVLGVLQHVGNPENMAKLAAGYDLTPDQIMNWLFQNTTKEDWDRAQRIGNVFKPVFEEADRRAYQRSGVTIKRVELQPIQTPFGTYEGWYNPIEYDRYRPGMKDKPSRGPTIDDLFQQGSIYRPVPAHGYAMARTGYVAPMDLTLNAVPRRLSQMIHDIHFRDPIMNIAKLVYDKDFISAVNHHMGPIWTDQFKAWLKDVANYSNYNSESSYWLSKTSEYFRQNVIHNLIGFNPHTVAKHGLTAAINSITEVGLGRFLKASATIFNATHDVSRANWRFAFDTSEELQRRMRNWSEMAEGKPDVGLLRSGGIRNFVHQIGATPVALGDMASSVPTWLAQFERSMRDGVTQGQAVMEADRAVRRAHGSSVITNRAQVMRGNALAQWYTSLYGFFSHMLQKQFEFAWKAKAAGKAGWEGDFREAWKYGKQLPGMLFSFVIWPAIIEEMVTPYTNEEKDSWGKKAAKALTLGVSSSWIGNRDAVHAFVNVRDTQAGLFGPLVQPIQLFLRDIPALVGGHTTVEQRGRAIRNANGTLGSLAGMSSMQIGRAAEFMYRYNHGLEHPKGFGWLYAATGRGEPGFITGLTRGTLKKRR